MKKKKIISIVLLVSILFFNVFVLNAQKAHAWPVSASIANLIPESVIVTTTGGTLAYNLSAKAMQIVQEIGVTGAKVLALLVVQAATALLIGGQDGDTLIRDYNNYLYISPQQRAMTQMNSFFNTVSKGRLSYFNYEGVGPNYDAYLVAQARQAISGQVFATTMQEYTTDPSQMFSDGNMKGIMAYMQCANNVACYTMTASAQYNQEFTKAQDLARSEAVNGFIPRKNSSGRITSPAALAQNALLQVDTLGTQVIMNADVKSNAAYAQIAAGAGISVLARTVGYYTADPAGQQQIRDKNDQFPFSLAYSTKGGVGFSAGGVTVNTGAGAISGSLQIGNTCALGNFTVDGSGATVDVNGARVNCPAGSKSSFSGTAPSASISLPAYNCQTGNLGDVACKGWFGSAYKCGSNSKCTQ